MSTYWDQQGDIRCVMAAHVDDILCATEAGAEGGLDGSSGRVCVREVEEDSLRICSKDVTQEKQEHSAISCGDVCGQIDAIRLDS